MAQESWNREEETGCQPPPEGPILCTNNCGFFGSVTTMNLCSKCYRELMLKQSSPVIDMSSLKGLVHPKGEESSQAEAQIESTAEAAATGAGTAAAAAATATADDGSSCSGKKDTNRCLACRKRVGLTGFKCRCGDTFCSLHRYSDKHGCKYDYKAAAREAIAKVNPVVKADKIEKI